ncbi:DUF1499 domain-containing protein [Caulobacter sp. 17J65-9]|uniref:DUF1499 domain-containing protein n=1 Tax=Caulobacter sp. 17J65-9 TaxID=2709382 RepID=UPI0013C8461B|nr:DUF1499 domain-containing protein [Caulobacter sp. 17J65-9]NEX91473.1 DUF1499 domain-containing protein [Caulobacter sp. 17J65-9]
MTRIERQSKGRKAAGLVVGLAVVVGLVAPVLLLVAALGAKAGAIDWKFALGVMTRSWVSIAAIVGVATGLVALLAAFTDFRRLGIPALIALLLPAAVLGGLFRFKQTAQSVPPIHDVSTNWEEPLGFSKKFMKLERVGAPNPVETDPRAPEKPGSPWSGRRVAEINAETCPGAKPVPRMVPPERVRQVLEDKGLAVFGSAPWMVEATAESTWFGFKDDVVVRMGPTRTDVRSISRVGVSDLGMNCKRVTEIVEALSK